MKKVIIIMFALGLSILVLGIPITIFKINDFYKQRDCYNYHLKECKDAHYLNRTYNHCSGFLSEPRDEDFNIYCSFHPREGCDIPYGCIL